MEEKNEAEFDEGKEELGSYSSEVGEGDNEFEDRDGSKEIDEDDPICAPCEDPDSIDDDVDIEAEVQRAATDPGQPTQAERDEQARRRVAASVMPQLHRRKRLLWATLNQA